MQPPYNQPIQAKGHPPNDHVTHQYQYQNQNQTEVNSPAKAPHSHHHDHMTASKWISEVASSHSLQSHLTVPLTNHDHKMTARSPKQEKPHFTANQEEFLSTPPQEQENRFRRKGFQPANIADFKSGSRFTIYGSSLDNPIVNEAGSVGRSRLSSFSRQISANTITRSNPNQIITSNPGTGTAGPFRKSANNLKDIIPVGLHGELHVGLVNPSQNTATKPLYVNVSNELLNTSSPLCNSTTTRGPTPYPVSPGKKMVSFQFDKNIDDRKMEMIIRKMTEVAESDYGNNCARIQRQQSSEFKKTSVSTVSPQMPSSITHKSPNSQDESLHNKDQLSSVYKKQTFYRSSHNNTSEPVKEVLKKNISSEYTETPHSFHSNRTESPYQVGIKVQRYASPSPVPTSSRNKLLIHEASQSKFPTRQHDSPRLSNPIAIETKSQVAQEKISPRFRTNLSEEIGANSSPRLVHVSMFHDSNDGQKKNTNYQQKPKNCEHYSHFGSYSGSNSNIAPESREITEDDISNTSNKRDALHYTDQKCIFEFKDKRESSSREHDEIDGNMRMMECGHHISRQMHYQLQSPHFASSSSSHCINNSIHPQIKYNAAQNSRMAYPSSLQSCDNNREILSSSLTSSCLGPIHHINDLMGPGQYLQNNDLNTSSKSTMQPSSINVITPMDGLEHSELQRTFDSVERQPRVPYKTDAIGRTVIQPEQIQDTSTDEIVIVGSDENDPINLYHSSNPNLGQRGDQRDFNNNNNLDEIDGFNIVTTRADTNVCFISPHELSSSSSMSCEEINDSYTSYPNTDCGPGYRFQHSYHGYDETDGSCQPTNVIDSHKANLFANKDKIERHTSILYTVTGASSPGNGLLRDSKLPPTKLCDRGQLLESPNHENECLTTSSAETPITMNESQTYRNTSICSSKHLSYSDQTLNSYHGKSAPPVIKRVETFENLSILKPKMLTEHKSYIRKSHREKRAGYIRTKTVQRRSQSKNNANARKSWTAYPSWKWDAGLSPSISKQGSHSMDDLLDCDKHRKIEFESDCDDLDEVDGFGNEDDDNKNPKPTTSLVKSASHEITSKLPIDDNTDVVHCFEDYQNKTPKKETDMVRCFEDTKLHLRDSRPSQPTIPGHENVTQIFDSQIMSVSYGQNIDVHCLGGDDTDGDNVVVENPFCQSPIHIDMKKKNHAIHRPSAVTPGRYDIEMTNARNHDRLLLVEDVERQYEPKIKTHKSYTENVRVNYISKSPKLEGIHLLGLSKKEINDNSSFHMSPKKINYNVQNDTTMACSNILQRPECSTSESEDQRNLSSKYKALFSNSIPPSGERNRDNAHYTTDHKTLQRHSLNSSSSKNVTKLHRPWLQSLPKHDSENSSVISAVNAIYNKISPEDISLEIPDKASDELDFHFTKSEGKFIQQRSGGDLSYLQSSKQHPQSVGTSNLAVNDFSRQTTSPGKQNQRYTQLKNLEHHIVSKLESLSNNSPTSGKMLSKSANILASGTSSPKSYNFSDGGGSGKPVNKTSLDNYKWPRTTRDITKSTKRPRAVARLDFDCYSSSSNPSTCSPTKQNILMHQQELSMIIDNIGSKDYFSGCLEPSSHEQKISTCISSSETPNDFQEERRKGTKKEPGNTFGHDNSSRLSERSKDEIDIRIQVTDVMEETRSISNRLKSMYQSNRKDCECDDAELEILKTSTDMFKKLCTASEAQANFIEQLQKTNTAVNDALDVASSLRQLCSHGRRVSDVFPGSVYLRIKCTTLKAALDLWHMHKAGELQSMLFVILGMRHLNTSPGLTLRVSIDETNILSCISYLYRQLNNVFKPSLPTRKSPKKPNPTKRTMRSTENLLSSPSSPVSSCTVHSRWSSSPMLPTRSPLASPLNSNSNSPAFPIYSREKKFSFSEVTRKAFQELNIKDPGHTSAHSLKEHPLLKPEVAMMVHSPNHVTSSGRPSPPQHSLLTSPLRMKRNGAQNEQENILHFRFEDESCYF